MTNQCSGPRPGRYDTRCDEARLDAPRSAVEFLRVLGREAGVAGLDGRQTNHEDAEEQADADHCTLGMRGDASKQPKERVLTDTVASALREYWITRRHG